MSVMHRSAMLAGVLALAGSAGATLAQSNLPEQLVINPTGSPRNYRQFRASGSRRIAKARKAKNKLRNGS